ncbi:MAG: hypothetical protein ACXWL5_01380 [Candidatus Chromulinivorax sp.]
MVVPENQLEPGQFALFDQERTIHAAPDEQDRIIIVFIYKKNS